MDLIALVAVAAPADIEQARAAVRLITSRGFHRDRDLPADLERFLNAEGRGSAPG